MASQTEMPFANESEIEESDAHPPAEKDGIVENQFGRHDLNQLEEELASYIVFRLPNIRRLNDSVAGEFPHSIYGKRAPMTSETARMCKLNLAHMTERVADAIAEILVENPRNPPQTVTTAHVKHAIDEYLKRGTAYNNM